MRRYQQPPPTKLFRGAEMTRLMTMIVMLGVIFLLMSRARDPQVWTWLTGEGDAAGGAGDAAAVPIGPDHSTPSAVYPSDTPSPGATDLDRDEADALKEELQAVEDKTPLKKQEMPAYWRLVRWQQRQTFDAMANRAERGVRFGQLFQRPSKYRGKLLYLRAHLKQTAVHDDVEDQAPGVKSIYEFWVWNSDSQPYSYLLVTSALPPGMPQGVNLSEEVSFVGYFLKLMAYEDHEGVHRASPLLIGRVVWHPSAVQQAKHAERFDYWPWLVGGGLLLLFVLRWRSRWFPQTSLRPPSRLGKLPDEDAMPVEQWLEDVDESPDSIEAQWAPDSIEQRFSEKDHDTTSGDGPPGPRA